MPGEYFSALVLLGASLAAFAQPQVQTVAGAPLPSRMAATSYIGVPLSVAVDRAGNCYFGTGVNFGPSGPNAVYRLDKSGQVTLVAGSGAATFFGDGGPATSAGFGDPQSLAVDKAHSWGEKASPAVELGWAQSIDGAQASNKPAQNVEVRIPHLRDGIRNGFPAGSDDKRHWPLLKSQL